MFGHEPVIRSLLDAAKPDVVVEIGIYRGATTRVALSVTAERGGTVHAIDPVLHPDFDLDAFQNEHGERFVLHRRLSLEALPQIHDVDAVLIDGDHNWYTVYNELTTIARVAAGDQRPFPLTLMHDVEWPYAYRDMYHDPETVPEEHRQPHERAGMRLNSERLVEDGGLNAFYNNALVEGGPRNGVRRAVEDFLAEVEAPVSLETVHGFFGLGVLYDERQLEQRPALRDAIADLGSPEFLRELCRRLEHGRLAALTKVQTMAARRSRARAAAGG